ncbi:MAG: DUF5995 family protein [Actinomycetota bacterium]|nr:DUF5995 family protein [Actinomycetota bacterium]
MPTVAPPLPARVGHVVPEQPPGDIDGVISRLSELQKALPRGDGTLYFNRLYLQMTKAVAELVSSGELAHPTFLERLDVVFAEPYFRAVASAATRPQTVSPAWQPLFEVRRDRRVAPVQFALAGMNAHINFDLSVGVVETCRELGLEPQDGTPQHRDFDRINSVIAKEEERVKRWLLTGLVRRLDRFLGNVDDVIANWSIDRAREGAWTNAKVLWELGDGPLGDAYKDALAHKVGLAGRGLLAPTIWGFQRWADWLRAI